jgi:hypothetical protein
MQGRSPWRSFLRRGACRSGLTLVAGVYFNRLKSLYSL